MRADIDGKPGIGAQWVSRQTNGIVAVAVKNALARAHAVLPSDMRSAPDDDTSYVGRRTKRNVRITLSGEHPPAAGQVMWPIMPEL